MKAVVYTDYGPPEVLRLQEVAKPAPGAKDVLIRNHATSVKYGDLAARNFKAISPREFNMPALFWPQQTQNTYPGQRVCRGS